jgi:hypothetical protein
VGNSALPATAKHSHRLDQYQGGACRRSTGCAARRSHRKEQPMLDVILLVVGLGFFAISIAYAFGCDRL